MKHTISTGIEIEDLRRLGLGVIVTNIDTRFMSLSWSSTIGFYINTSSCWLSNHHEISQFSKELEIMSRSIVEANDVIS